MPKISQKGFSISGEIPHPWKTPAIFAMAQLKAANYNVEFLSDFRGHRCALRLNFGFGNSVTSRDHRNLILYKMQHIKEKLSTAKNLAFMNNTSLDKAPVFTMSDEINERILDQVNKHKYADFIENMNSIPDSGFLHDSIIDKLRTTAIKSNNLVVYQYLVQRFTNEIVSRSDDTMKKISCPGVSVDTFAGIISSRPGLSEKSRPVEYIYLMISQCYDICNDKTPKTCNCLENLISKITCVLKIPTLDTSQDIFRAFYFVITLYDEHIAINHHSNRILCLLFDHATKNNIYFDAALLNEIIYDMLRKSKQPLVFCKFYHEILDLPIDFSDRKFGNSLWAVRDIECGKYLIKNGVDVNWRNRDGHNVVQDMIYNLQWTEREDLGGNLLRYMQWLVTSCHVNMGSRYQIEEWIERYFRLLNNPEYYNDGISVPFKLKHPNIVFEEIRQENLDVIDWVRGYFNQRTGSKKIRRDEYSLSRFSGQ